MSRNLKFEIDWLGTSSSVRSAELRETWARLTISVGDDVVTLVEDVQNRSIRRSIYVSLYPFAEWIATNWWLLRFNGRGQRRFDVERRQTTLGAGDGFLWPDLRIVPEGESTELTWWSDQRPRVGAESRYLAQGTATVSSDETMFELTRLVQAVIDRLDEADLNETPLHKEWSASTGLDSDESEFAEASARLGLDPFSDGIDFAALIESAFASLDPAVRDDFLDAVSPRGIEESLDWVSRGLIKVPPGVSDLGLERIRSEFGVTPRLDSVAPWQLGWESARRVREIMDVATGAPVEQIPVQQNFEASGRREIMGVGCGFGDGIGLVTSRNLNEASNRFHRARAIWHALAHDNGEPFLLTSAFSTSQSVGRAFATEFLAPSSGLDTFLAGDFTSDAIQDAAVHFDAPVEVVRHQVENQLAG